MSFWQGFKIGALSALVYNAVKNPGSCCCCAVLLLIIGLALVVLVVAFVIEIRTFLLAGFLLWGIFLAARYLWRRYR